jgi:hypothetical protein
MNMKTYKVLAGRRLVDLKIDGTVLNKKSGKN